ncbi:MAG: RNA polymerase sigma factor [Candidatus Moranbacteria bacterium]|nr:RNA polymerase sigma factor [Candidatus Moranbacteria bacterium]MDD3964549.1 RNA polymerase sigma factor [Candidatus Moranbacteria bacterium]
MMQDDQQLISRFLNGDDQAFEMLTKQYLSRLYNFIFQFTHEEQVTEDIVQETFIKVWKNIDRLDQNKSFKTWIFTIAKNTLYDYLKKKKSIPFSSFVDEEGENTLEVIDEDALLPNEVMENAERIEDLERALARVPELYRILLVLAYREDFSLREIAHILDEPYNTIKSRHQRALKLLKKAFFDESASEKEGSSY